MAFSKKESVKKWFILEENIGVNLHDPGFGKGFLDMTPKAEATKEKKKKQINWTSSKRKKFCASKDTIKNVTRHT